MVFYNLGALQGIVWTAVQWQQLIKRMEPLAEDNEKLIKRDLAESNTKDLEYQKSTLSEQLKIVSEQLGRTSEQLKSSFEQLECTFEQLRNIS